MTKIKTIRFNIIKIFIIISFSIIFIRLFSITIINNKKYKENLNNLVYQEVYGESAPRGRIYDRNYNLLVDNVGVKSIYFKRKSGMSTKATIEVANKLSKILDLDYDLCTKSMIKTLWILLNEEEASNKITDIEWDKLKQRKISYNDIESYKRERITDEEMGSIDKRCAYIYYLMNNGYSYQEKLIKKDVSDYEYALINANLLAYPGVIPRLSWDRVYLYGDTLRGIFGNVSSLEVGITDELKDYYLNKGYSITDRVGLSGLELMYDEYLKGTPAVYKNLGNGLEKIKDEKRGNDLVLSIDINLQKEAEKIVEEEMIKTKNEPNTEYFNRVFSIVSDPNNGEVLTIVSKIINNNKVYDYTSFITSSSITVGSVIKGASISVGYKEKVIDIGTVLKDECVKLAGTSAKCSWDRNGLGFINDVNALRLSSNVYQFKIAMKVADFDYYYNSSFKINNDAFDKYRKMFNSYGLGSLTGIDLPNESVGLKGSKDTPGLLLDFSIGQYDTYTPFQLTQYINTIANKGNRYKLSLLKSVHKSTTSEISDDVIINNSKILLNKIDLESKYIDRIREGFKEVLGYTGTGYGYIDIKYNPAGKTGTSQSFYDSDKDGVIDKETISSTFAGFAPFDNPKMSIVVVTPDVSHIYKNNYLSSINKRISAQISKKYFEICK